MKKLIILLLLFFPIVCSAQNLNKQVERAIVRGIVGTPVKVDIKLVKPVYMSDVMFRPVRGKNRVIRMDYKQVTCQGYSSAQKTYVWVPTSCVVEKKYRVSKVRVTFPDGSTVEKPGQNVKRKNDQKSYIKL